MSLAPAAPDDVSAWARLRRVVAGLGCAPAEVIALGVLLAGALAALGMLWLLARPGDAIQAVAEPQAAGDALGVTDEPLVVHVAGHVAAPGVYRLTVGARVTDALEEAGGALPDARLDAVNLARTLSDGEQLVVPGPADGDGGGGGDGGEAPAASAWRPDGTLDLNRASAEDLEELPGIGPVLAERIVDHREQKGGFRHVGDLREVAGIGEKTFQSLAELVAV